MNPKKIIIATASILLLFILLNGCKLIEKAEEQEAKETEIQQLVKKAEAVKKEVNLVLKANKENNQVKVKITLENPNQKPVTSVQSWFSFDATKLQGATIDTSGSAFSLMAPYDNNFDNENGLVMLGRSNPDPVTDQAIDVAEMVFDIVGEGTIMIDVYDYRENLTGHTSANTVIDEKPYNILIKPESPALVIEN